MWSDDIEIDVTDVCDGHAVRIVGFSLYLAVENPSRSLLIAEVILQSIGLSPLLIELIFTVLWWYVPLYRCLNLPPCLNLVFI